MNLYTYFRSSAAFRVRIALALKGLDVTAIPIHLLRGGGEQHSAAFIAHNPAGLVPVLQDSQLTLTQSLAIIEYLEETRPLPALLPPSPVDRAHVRELALCIACDIHPLNNLRVMRYLKETLGVADAERDVWTRHWIGLGFAALEGLWRKTPTAGVHCFGDTPTLADCCLVPQVFNALRAKLALDDFPTIRRIYDHCMQLPAFQRAAPGAQVDAEK
jgi:maleylpyruvate isomerase